MSDSHTLSQNGFRSCDHLSSSLTIITAKIIRDQTELFQTGFEIVDDFREQ